ncbi:MAG: hypothetical protein JNL70_01685 [Saprospiraceae bacterium]|nr:hypothetical protein [Saprospiraceae bacterium]
MKYFENISADELQILENAVSQIAVLIAGADGTIDKDETDWASKLMHIRSYSGDKSLQEFYEQVEANFNIKFRDLVKNSSQNTAERQAALSESIAQVNPILAKLDARTSYHVYHSYVTLAKSIAKASGGILGFGSVSGAEEKLLGLPMITPIPPFVDENEEETEE